MAFSIDDLQDLIALLAEKPEWRAQLRPLILGDELDRLPQVVLELGEAQRRTEARVAELTDMVKELVGGQREVGGKAASQHLLDFARLRDVEVRLLDSAG